MRCRIGSDRVAVRSLGAVAGRGGGECGGWFRIWGARIAGRWPSAAPNASPDRLQHLLGRAKWDAEELREDLRSYVVDHLGDDDAVLVVDETGDVKKGTCTVGVQREYTG